MNGQKTSTLSSVLLWFGAAVSIAEIMTGAVFAPLGMWRGAAAIVIGHLIGGGLMYSVGLVGAKTGYAGIESAGISFGARGANIFAVLNILQLVGWTAVMIIGGGRALDLTVSGIFGAGNSALSCSAIGALIVVWVIIDIKNLGKVNVFVIGLLFLLTILLSGAVFFRSTASAFEFEPLSFGQAVELAAAMPLSWLPLISDYTRYAKKPVSHTAGGCLAYFFGSIWMYIIGLGAAILTGSGDVAQIMVNVGFGFAALFIVIASTVTTTFLDVFSTGVSVKNIWPGSNAKIISIAAAVLGTLIALFTPIEKYENFLYLIGSVFAPMAAILITDFYILKKRAVKGNVNIANITIWAAGFIIYRLIMNLESPIGVTLPVMAITGGITWLTDHRRNSL
jgi:putative hydroxymethylpyrimidine transporter CytX